MKGSKIRHIRSWDYPEAPTESVACLPHILTIDMKEDKAIRSIELVRMQNGKDIKRVVFSISPDKENWEELGELIFPNEVDPRTKSSVLPQEANGRYIRVTVAESNRVPHANIAEILVTADLK